MQNKNIYHITHINNLETILKKGLKCNNLIENYENIGDRTLKVSRGLKEVGIKPFGTLNDYVPFYLGRRSVMLYKIFKNNVDSVNCNQDEIVYIVVRVKDIIDSGIEFVFTDGQGYHHLSKYYNDINDLNKLEWDVINTDSWGDTYEDNDRKRKKQAEFLVFKKLSASYIFGIGVMNEKAQEKVKQILDKMSVGISCIIKREWYY